MEETKHRQQTSSLTKKQPQDLTTAPLFPADLVSASLLQKERENRNSDIEYCCQIIKEKDEIIDTITQRTRDYFEEKNKSAVEIVLPGAAKLPQCEVDHVKTRVNSFLEILENGIKGSRKLSGSKN